MYPAGQELEEPRPKQSAQRYVRTRPASFARMSEPAILPAERRGAARIAVRFPVLLERLETIVVETEAANISSTGVLVRSPVELPVWGRFTARLPGPDLREVRIVRRDGNSYGCLFQTPLEEEELNAVLASDEAMAGFERLRAEAEAPPAPERKSVLRFLSRRQG